MTCTRDYCKQKTGYIYFGRSLEKTRSFQCRFSAAPNTTQHLPCCAGGSRFPPSLPDSLFALTSGISGGQYLLMKCCSIVVEYLYFYLSCLLTSKATVFCSRICSLSSSLVREYNLFHILYSSVVAPLWLHFVFLILSFNSFILTHSKHILA